MYAASRLAGPVLPTKTQHLPPKQIAGNSGRYKRNWVGKRVPMETIYVAPKSETKCGETSEVCYSHK